MGWAGLALAVLLAGCVIGGYAWLPLTIASTDLTNGRLVNHVTGRMADALYASISIPGVFPPVDIDGALHVEGRLRLPHLPEAVSQLAGRSAGGVGLGCGGGAAVPTVRDVPGRQSGEMLQKGSGQGEVDRKSVV